MKESTLNGYRLLLVPVKEGTDELLLIHGKLYYLTPESDKSKWADLPPGLWHLLGLASEIREEEAAGVVECKNHPFLLNLIYYKDYLSREPIMWIHHATASLHSFVRSQGMDEKRTVILYEPKK